MAKHNCAICGAEVGLISEQKLADGNYICRKVCSKKCLKILRQGRSNTGFGKTHIEQVEFGTKVWDQIFVPAEKNKDQGRKAEVLRQKRCAVRFSFHRTCGYYGKPL